MAGVGAAYFLDRILGTRVMAGRVYWIFMAIMMSCEMIVNGFLSARPVFLYNPAHLSGLYLGTIPMEDFFFGFAFITVVVVLWEVLKIRVEGKKLR
jgi:lycopene cyclase domain-containing protein